MGSSRGDSGDPRWPWGRVPVLFPPPQGWGIWARGARHWFFPCKLVFIFGGFLLPAGLRGPCIPSAPPCLASPPPRRWERKKLEKSGFFFLIDFSPKRKQTGMLVGSCLLQTKAAQPVSPRRDLRAGGRYLRPPPHISGCRPHSSASLLPPSPGWGRKAGKAVPGVEGRDFGAPWAHIKGCLVPTEVPKPRRVLCTSILPAAHRDIASCLTK